MNRCANLLIVFASVFLLTSVAHANGILLEPMRVELKNGQRYATVTVLNQSMTEPVKYSISTTPMRMTKQGELVSPERPTKRERLTVSMVRFSPRSTVIPPGGSQAVRIVVRRPPNLPEGEYMTYMQVSPSEINPVVKAKPDSSSAGSSLEVKMLVGMSIPIIFHEGSPKVSTTVQSARVKRTATGKPAVDVTINRSGKKSSFVGVSVYSVANGKKELIAHKPRLVTYFPLKARDYLLPANAPIHKGMKLLIELSDYNDPNKKIVDSKTVILN